LQLYFDQQSNVTDRLLDGTTVHVGISAQGYPFPAPTGIADNDLRKPGKDLVASIGLNFGPFATKSLELDLQVPVQGEKLGLIAGIGLYREEAPFGGRPHYDSYALSARWAPDTNTSIQPFWSRIAVRSEESQSYIFTSGDFLPKRYKRGQFFGQKWAEFNSNIDTYGTVAKTKLAGFDLALGAFRQTVDARDDNIDLLFDTDQTGRVGSRIIVSEKDNWFASTSGEFKLSREFSDGPRRHYIHATARGRSLVRRYGGAALIDLGVSQVGMEDFRPAPVGTVYGAKTHDRVRQKTAGVGYELRWKKLGEISLGVQKTDYSKSVVDPVTGALPVSKDSPWLYSATAAAYLADNVALYGGFVRGLEESEVAPVNAINRGDAPPAIRTTQKDFGVRWGVSKGVTMVIGWFDVRKPYYNLDASSRFRRLGAIRNSGVEFSLSGQVAPGLTVVAGSIWLDSKLSGEEVDRGVIGKRPVGSFRLHNLANVNWKFPWHDPLTLTARFESTSNRVANATNTFVIPKRWVASLGARYKMKVADKPLLVRANVDNIFNTFGWNNGGGGFFMPNGPRRYSLSLAADI
jgi:iron complex outermembrane receptor protein